MSRNRMSMLRNLAKNTLKYGIEYIISQNADRIADKLLKGSEFAKNLGVKNEVVENLLDKGIRGISDIKKIQPGFFEKEVLPVSEVIISDIINMNKSNNAGNSAYPQENYSQKVTPSSEKYFYDSKENLTVNDYFKNVKKQKDDDIFRESKKRMPVSLFLPNMSKDDEKLPVEKISEQIIKQSNKKIKGGHKKPIKTAESKQNVSKEMNSKQNKSGKRKIRPDVAKARKEIKEFNKANKKKNNYLYKVEL